MFVESSYTEGFSFFAVLLVQELSGFLKNTHVLRVAWYLCSRRVCPSPPSATPPESDRASERGVCSCACQRLSAQTHPYADEDSVFDIISYGQSDLR